MSRGRFLIGACALVVAPPALLAFLVAQATASDQALLDVVLPALAGAAVGASIVAFGYRRSRRRSKNRTPKAELGPVGVGLIVVAAVVASLQSLLPTAVQALVDGWALGVLVTLYVVLVKLWRHDVGFRKRVKLLSPFGS
ncbi:MAG TPA: hypothetical protein VLU96_00710 [Gaiellaceae bacterium]|nr:hypothetical protein [Gaiellaceae bacterium]